MGQLTSSLAKLTVGTTCGPRPQRVRIPLERLRTHAFVCDLTGGGKTRWMANLFRELATKTAASAIVIDPKGDLADLALPLALEAGLAEDVILWDFRDERVVLGYDPLARSGVRVPLRAKFASEATRAAWGQETFDRTPRLKKFLYCGYAAAAYLGLGIEGALELLRARSALRDRVISAIPDPFVQEEFVQFANESPARRAEISESAVSRLGSFVGDPGIARILTEREHVLDLDAVLFGPRRKLLIINLACPQALAEDDCRLLARFLVTDILSRRLARGAAAARRPTVLFIDELGYAITNSLCRAFDWGRSFGLWLVVACQRLSQLRQEGEELELAVLSDARMKVIGAALAEDLERLMSEVAIEEYDPMKVKDELYRLENIVSETTRVQRSRGRSVSNGYGISYPSATARGVSKQRGASKTRSVTKMLATGTVESEADVDGESWGTSAGVMSGVAIATTPEGDVIGTTHTGSTSGEISLTSRSHVRGRAIIKTEGESWGKAQSTQRSHTRTITDTEGETPSWNHAETESESETVVPFHETRQKRVVASREFQSREEFITCEVIASKRQLTGHYTLKVPGHPLLRIRAPYLPDPWITPSRIEALTQRIYTQACYRTGEIEPPAPPITQMAKEAKVPKKKLPRTGQAWDFMLPKPTDKPKR